MIHRRTVIDDETLPDGTRVIRKRELVWGQDGEQVVSEEVIEQTGTHYVLELVEEGKEWTR